MSASYKLRKWSIYGLKRVNSVFVKPGIIIFKARKGFYTSKLIRNDILHLIIRVLVYLFFQDGRQWPSWILPIFKKA